MSLRGKNVNYVALLDHVTLADAAECKVVRRTQWG